MQVFGLKVYNDPRFKVSSYIWTFTRVDTLVPFACCLIFVFFFTLSQLISPCDCRGNTAPCTNHGDRSCCSRGLRATWHDVRPSVSQISSRAPRSSSNFATSWCPQEEATQASWDGLMYLGSYQLEDTYHSAVVSGPLHPAKKQSPIWKYFSPLVCECCGKDGQQEILFRKPFSKERKSKAFSNEYSYPQKECTCRNKNKRSCICAHPR